MVREEVVCWGRKDATKTSPPPRATRQVKNVGPTMVLEKETLTMKFDCIGEQVEVDIHDLTPNMAFKKANDPHSGFVHECSRLAFAWEGVKRSRDATKDEDAHRGDECPFRAIAEADLNTGVFIVLTARLLVVIRQN